MSKWQIWNSELRRAVDGLICSLLFVDLLFSSAKPTLKTALAALAKLLTEPAHRGGFFEDLFCRSGIALGPTTEALTISQALGAFLGRALATLAVGLSTGWGLFGLLE